MAFLNPPYPIGFRLGCFGGLALVAVAVALSQEPAAPQGAPKAPGAKKENAAGIPASLLKEFGANGPDPAAVDRGKKLFVASCAFCHGSSATGGEGGPDLVRSVLVLHDKGGDQVGPVILNGRLEKGMPKFAMTAEQIQDIAAFLKAATLAKANRMSYELQNIVTGDPQKGKAYFYGEGKCSGCHSADKDLKGIASRLDAPALQSRFLYPRMFRWPGMPQVGPPPKPTMVTVTLPNGQSVKGELKHLDDFNVALVDSDQEYRSWDRDAYPGMKVQVEDPLHAHIELLAKYSDADMHNILAYLETMK